MVRYINFIAFHVGYIPKFPNYGPLIWPPTCNELILKEYAVWGVQFFFSII